jgi:hypothetical protein
MINFIFIFGNLIPKPLTITLTGRLSKKKEKTKLKPYTQETLYLKTNINLNQRFLQKIIIKEN